MLMTRRGAVVLGAALPLARAAAEAVLPSGPIRVIVPFPPGGTMDVVARQLAPVVAEVLGQPVVVDNRPGGGTVIGTEVAARAAPDGGTVLMVANSFLINGGLPRPLPYDPLRDFVPAALLTVVPHVLTVHPRLAEDFAGFLAVGRGAGAGLSFGSYGNGTSNHLGAEQLTRLARLNATHVPYRGAAQAYTDLFAGRVDWMFANRPDVIQPRQAGQVRTLAIAAPARSPQLPEVPTLAELGFGGVLSDTWFGLVAPAGTPAAAVARHGAAWLEALARPTLRRALEGQGFAVLAEPAAAFGAKLRQDFDTYVQVIRAADVRGD